MTPLNPQVIRVYQFSLFALSPPCWINKEEENYRIIIITIIIYYTISEPHGSQMANKNRCKSYMPSKSFLPFLSMQNDFCSYFWSVVFQTTHLKILSIKVISNRIEGNTSLPNFFLLFFKACSVICSINKFPFQWAVEQMENWIHHTTY